MQDKIYMTEESVIDGNLLYEIVQQHYKKKVARFDYLYRLYKGEHDILKRTVSDPNKPNNKLINNYFGEIVDTIVGYFLGNPIVITIEDDEIQDELDYILEDNEVNDLFLDVGKESGIKGRSAIMVYQNENSETKLVRIPAEEVIFVYDSSKPDDVLYAIRVYEMDVIGKDEPVRYAEVWGKEEVSYWIEDSELGLFREDPNRPAEAHIFGDVPIVEIVNNSERQGDFEKVITLVNDFDKVFSNASNEIEAFRNAYLMIKNMMVDSETLKKLQEMGVIEVGESGDVKFVTKDLPNVFIKEHLDRLQNNIYRFAQVPNLSDENFANNLSGVAIRFKLFGLETKCIQKERKMTKAIKRLLKLLSVPIQVRTGKAIDLRTVDIKFTRNVPNNITELADVVSKLNGLVDKETLLSLLPFIDDPKGVLEALEKENDPYAQDMDKFMNGFGQEPTTDDESGTNTVIEGV